MEETEFKFSVDVRARFSDMDSLGHVNNAAYITYFEEGRVHYFRKLFDLPMEDSSTLGLIVLDMHCAYRSPAFYGEILRVYTRVNWLKDKSFEMAYLIMETETGRTVAEGSSILVSYDYSTRTTIEIPDSFRKKVSAFEGIPPRRD